MLIEEDNRTEASALISSNNTVAQQPDTKSLIPSQVSAAQENPDTYLIADFPVVLQMPELPTGCEITAMTMVLNYYGYMVSKEEMAVEYLPTVPANLYYGSDGRLYGPDLNRYFVGNPTTNGRVYLWNGSNPYCYEYLP